MSGSQPDADSEAGQQHDPEQPLESIPLDIESTWSAWLCVLGSFMFLVPSFGFMQSLGTIQSYLSLNQLSDYSTGEVGWISSVYLFLSLVLGLRVGPIFDAHGPRILGPLGAVLVIATYLLMAECKEYWQFMLCLGIFGAFGAAMTMVVAVSTVGKLFVRRRGFAMGIALAGSSIGSIIFPIMLRSTFPNLGWRWSMRITGFFAAGLMLPAVLCFLPYQRLIPASSQQVSKGSALNLGAFSNPAFNLVTAGMFMLEFVIFGIGALLPTIATGAGFTPENGFLLLAIIGGTSTIGRVVPGIIGDRVGHFNVILAMMAVTIVFMGTLFVPFGTTSAPVLYAFSALWGIGSGSFLSVTPVCLGKTCEPKEYGTYYGTMNFVVAFSLLISLPLSGIMLDNMGAQPLAGLYIAILFVGAVCMFAARALLIGKWLSPKTII
ncbi:major facilitator superfamily domain-containing protein [Ilyonectria robusta]|uniref:major facilitator superfamily domain-containing protein n=1 Tax=Ilyonectria robusta TaxID=1079257 RepID=UPI001E8CF46A|nr:major facilitator superfamily domain-containing protein [Ilyonectria robusta]KAH8679140.1 major facilitator superfamily domain-containing protein [Ilyonectria robusta]